MLAASLLFLSLLQATPAAGTRPAEARDTPRFTTSTGI